MRKRIISRLSICIIIFVWAMRVWGCFTVMEANQDLWFLPIHEKNMAF
jgi:hypothetical protein